MADKACILVIDDETGPRESLRMILKNDYEVHLAASPLEGLRLAEELHPDLVFLDIKMPEMDGTEVLRRLKQMDEDIEVAMITAFAALETAQEAVRHGAIDYLTKPFGMDQVLGVVERALDRREERRDRQMVFEQLQEATRNLSRQLQEMRQHSEFADLSTVYESLTAAHDSIETQLDGMARLRAIGEIAAEVAHDVDNILGSILLRIEMLLLNLRESPQVQVDRLESFLHDILQATQDSSQAISRISLVSHDPYEPSAAVQVNDLLREAINLSAARSAREGQEVISEDFAELPLIKGNAPGLRTAFMNLLVNARLAVAEGGEIALATRLEDDQVVVRIGDTGVGMTPEVLEKVEEPFYTTRGTEGSGLGLSITRKVVARHGGALRFESAPGVGTTVTVSLPLSPPEAAPATTSAAVPDVMLVEDDERQLEVMEGYLSSQGLKVHATSSSPAALAYFQHYLEEFGQAPRVVVTDLRMPEMLGTDLAQELKALAPDTRVVLLSAYVDHSAELASNPYLDALLAKPFKLPDLMSAVKGGS